VRAYKLVEEKEGTEQGRRGGGEVGGDRPPHPIFEIHLQCYKYVHTAVIAQYKLICCTVCMCTITFNTGQSLLM